MKPESTAEHKKIQPTEPECSPVLRAGLFIALILVLVLG